VESIAKAIAEYLMGGTPAQVAVLSHPNTTQGAQVLPASAFRYERRLPAAVSLSPQERSADDEYDRSPANRAELEQAMRGEGAYAGYEKRPGANRVLSKEYNRLFGGRR
jgi:hypothetical protein